MTMAAAIESRTAEASARPMAGRIASVDIVGDLGKIEAIWRGFEKEQQLFTPYQRFEFLSTWQRRVGDHEGASPFIVIARDAERRPLLLLPLTLATRYGVRTASFMGGKHATFNMALWDRDFASDATAADLAALISKLRERSQADLLALTQQPERWRGVPNPFVMLPHQPSVNDCPVLHMVPGSAPELRIGHSFRRRLKAKEGKLQKLPGYRYRIAATEADVRGLLDWFFRTKPLRMAERGLPNVFADGGVEAFIREACMMPLPGDDRVITIHALECDEEIIALYAGVADGYRFSMMFNTYTTSAHSRHSPGLILLRYIVDHYAARGYRAVDLGIGLDGYKRMFCKSDEPIFDSFIPLSARGSLAAAAMSTLNRGKRRVKQDRMLLQLAQALRTAFR